MKERLRAAILGTFMLVAALAVLPSGVSLADYDQGGPPPSLGIARVSYLAGDALFNSPDTDEWAAVTPNFSLRDGDRLWAGDDSKIEVRFRNGGTAWLNYNSELDMVKLQPDRDGDIFQVGLVTGEASFKVENFRVLRSVFQVDTPTASIRAYGRALFRVTSTSDGATQVGVMRGSVEVETQTGITTAGKGDLLEVASDGYTQVSDLPAKDAWDNWVDSRLARYARPAKSASYLPPDMDDYAYEFDNDGRWTSFGAYGNVWVPTSVGPDWSPYSNGRWVYAGGDYIWLGYDPWYAPFHYGRWYWGVSIGWFWIPPVASAVYWSPGYVGWCYGPASVYWVPLGPGEIYYGHGYYGPQSVNIVNVKQVNVTNVYVNARFRNGVVAVHNDDFRRGRIARERVRIREHENPFTNRGRIKDVRLTGAAPVREIKPTKELRLPRPDVRPPRTALPPERVERSAPLIRKRAVAREEGTSAFRPGTRPQRKEERIQQRGQIREERPQRREQGREQGIQPPAQKREGVIQQREQKQQERLQQRDQKQEQRFQQRQRPQEQLQQREQGIQQRQQKQQERIQQPVQKKEEVVPQREQKQQEQIQPREQGIQQRQQKQQERIQQPVQKREGVIQQREQRQQEQLQQPEQGIQQRQQKQEQRLQQLQQKQQERTQQPAQKKEEVVPQPQQPQQQQERVPQIQQKREMRQPGFRRERGAAPPEKAVKPEKEKKPKEQKPSEEKPKEGEGGQ